MSNSSLYVVKKTNTQTVNGEKDSMISAYYQFIENEQYLERAMETTYGHYQPLLILILFFSFDQ